MIKPGDIVEFAKMPGWVAEMPEETQRVFGACLGKCFRVAELDRNGVCILDVSELIDPIFRGTGNDIRLEPEFLKKG